jgi:hypothetical protein
VFLNFLCQQVSAAFLFDAFCLRIMYIATPALAGTANQFNLHRQVAARSSHAHRFSLLFSKTNKLCCYIQGIDICLLLTPVCLKKHLAACLVWYSRDVWFEYEFWDKMKWRQRSAMPWRRIGIFEVKLHTLTSTIVGGESSVSSSGRFTYTQINPRITWLLVED